MAYRRHRGSQQWIATAAASSGDGGGRKEGRRLRAAGRADARRGGGASGCGKLPHCAFRPAVAALASAAMHSGLCWRPALQERRGSPRPRSRPHPPR
ncbi:hypothetical protein LA76x_0759 [Lysobacter antibioticus]|uniref:Uncharacterized protein n=1 Tax=Lysobacter antibioticus TaxID=84531 RepID=A0A0S2F5V3_LYSAN|nr:hypothetical protein LA76x_0759 [Lysobacter antibioticus]